MVRTEANIKAEKKYRKTEKFKIKEQRFTKSEKRKIWLKEYRKSEKFKTYNSNYRKTQKSKDVQNALKAKYRKTQSYKNRKNLWEKKTKSSNPEYKLSVQLRVRLNSAIRRNTKFGSAIKDLGCSISELKTYLEKQFKDRMTWDNWSRNGWHIDHIIPLSSFNLANKDEFQKAVNYKNLQPLWARDNLVKGDRIGCPL